MFHSPCEIISVLPWTFSTDGSIVTVGSSGSSNNDEGSIRGHVYVFFFDNESNDWEPLGVAIPGVDVDDRFGQSVALSSDGMLMAVGAPGNNGNGLRSGQVRVFAYDKELRDWAQQGPNITGILSDTSFGTSVALSGKVLVAGTSTWSNRDR